MKYVLRANVYCENPNDENDFDYTKPKYLGVEGEKKLYIFDEKIVGRTKVFATATEAGEYVDKHFRNAQRCSYKTIDIVEIADEKNM